MSNKILIVFINAIIFTLAFNAYIIAGRYIDYQIAGVDAIIIALMNSVFALAFVFPLIYICSSSRFLVIIIYLVSGLSAYFIYRYNIRIDQEIIASFFEASRLEASNFLNLELVFALVYSVMLGIIYRS